MKNVASKKSEIVPYFHSVSYIVLWFLQIALKISTIEKHIKKGWPWKIIKTRFAFN